MKFSIITICLNEEERIALTAKSIQEQAFDDFEWLVFDGGSSDKTLEILDSFKIPNMVIHHDVKGGIYPSMNFAISKCRGDFILFLNGGDYLFNSSVLECVNTALKSSECIFYGHSIVEQRCSLHPNPILKRSNRPLKMNFFLNMSLPHQGTFVRRSLFDKIGVFSSKYKIAGDTEFNLRAIDNGIQFVYSPIVVSIVDGTGVSVKRNAELKSELDELRDAYLNGFQKFLVRVLRKVFHKFRKK